MYAIRLGLHPFGCISCINTIATHVPVFPGLLGVCDTKSSCELNRVRQLLSNRIHAEL